MASSFRSVVFRFSKGKLNILTNKNVFQLQKNKLCIASTALITGSGMYFIFFKNRSIFNTFDFLKEKIPFVRFAEAKSNVIEGQDEKTHAKTVENLGSREKRFLSFASMKYNEVAYMTPEDFLESVTQDQPRTRSRKIVLTKEDLSKLLESTPSKYRPSPTLFRSMGTKGLISYTEYLFLLCIITKPHSGFRIAFNMFDTDMNEEIDKTEFLVMERVLRQRKSETSSTVSPEADKTASKSTWFVFKLLNKIMTSKFESDVAEEVDASKETDAENPVSAETKEVNIVVQTTTLLTHFFGKNGKDKLNYGEFYKFMENLQTEILQIEFTEYSRGLKTMAESDFARILLRYTKVRKDLHESYISKIRGRLRKKEIKPDRIFMDHGISFEEFKKFFQFLNNIDDFALAMKMYTLADRPISQEEFQQAVKACIGSQLSPHLVDTVFNIFDEDGDGHLSYKEFIHIMKDRLSRGLSQSQKQSPTRWAFYQHCVSKQLREA